MADDGALAEALFQQGQELMAQGDYAKACPKLAESQRLDPSTGTLLNLAVCHEKEGRLATAWNEFNQALAVARRDNRADRVRFAEEHIASLEPQLSHLTITLPAEHEVPNLTVELDGTQVGPAALGVALPVDPGPHQIVVSAPDKQPWKTSVQLEAGPSSASVTIPQLVDAPQAAKSDGGQASEPNDSAGRKGTTQRWIAVGLAGAAVVAAGIGTGFGVDALSKFDASNENGCSDNECNAAGADQRDAARASGNVSTAAFIASGVLMGTAVVLYFTAPKTSAETAALRPPRSEVRWSAGLRPRIAGASIEMGATW